MHSSVYFNPRQLSVISRISNLLLPAHGAFPAFSHTGTLTHIDDLMAPTHANDIGDLKIVLSVLSLLPNVALAWVLRRAMAAHEQHHWLATPLRQLDIGLRGIIYSLYYANLCGAGMQATVFDAIDYHLYYSVDEGSATDASFQPSSQKERQYEQHPNHH